MQLTKTDFIQYLNCPKSLWLRKHEPENYPQGDFSAFMKKIIREGYEVESVVQQYFRDTKEQSEIDFQAEFQTCEGLYARADVLECAGSDGTIIYEIKSSTQVKTDKNHNHIKDACFQKICAERAGQAIDQIFIVHLNGSYVRDGEIDPEGLLTFVDVTDDVEQIFEETTSEIEEALTLLEQTEIDRNGCSCLYKSRANHCDTFSDFNPEVPAESVYSIPRLSDKKRLELIDGGVVSLGDIPDGYQLSEKQQLIVDAAKSEQPHCDVDEIRRFLDELDFPIYFFDYETFSSAVPLIDGTSPHKQIPVQYSLHIMEEGGVLRHCEYLERRLCLPELLIEQMQKDIGTTGSVISWHASFEKTQNREIAKLFPEKEEFLLDINTRMVDLEDVFKEAYIDSSFEGSTSIKKVLPVLCPGMNYDDLDLKGGTEAMEAWQRMIKTESKEAGEIASNLLKYCERDTLAMVEIYRFLTGLIH